jgi:hypothetical protein
MSQLSSHISQVRQRIAQCTELTKKARSSAASADSSVPTEFGWIESALDAGSKELEEIDAEIVEAKWRQHDPTFDFFEKHVNSALYQLEESPIGVLRACY